MLGIGVEWWILYTIIIMITLVTAIVRLHVAVNVRDPLIDLIEGIYNLLGNMNDHLRGTEEGLMTMTNNVMLDKIEYDISNIVGELIEIKHEIKRISDKTD